MPGERTTGYLRSRMAGDTIDVGDRVVNLQVPGVFQVVARRGAFLDIETAHGQLRMTVLDSAVRKLADVPPPAAAEG